MDAVRPGASVANLAGIDKPTAEDWDGWLGGDFHGKKKRIISWIASQEDDAGKFLGKVSNPDLDVTKKSKCPKKCYVVFSDPKKNKKGFETQKTVADVASEFGHSGR